MIKNIIGATPKLTQLKKWKEDSGLFMAQLEKEQIIDTTIWENDFVIGNQDAPLMITVACSPYCMPCAITHERLDELLHKYSNTLKVQVRLLCDPANEKDTKTIAVKAILKKAAETNKNNDRHQMFTDWFAWMNYEKWNRKWYSKKNINTDEVLQKHADWMNNSNITHTPTIFLNGRKLPGRYGLKELEKLIPQLAEEMKIL